MTSQVLLKADALHKAYGPTPALAGPPVQIAPG